MHKGEKNTSIVTHSHIKERSHNPQLWRGERNRQLHTSPSERVKNVFKNMKPMVNIILHLISYNLRDHISNRQLTIL